MLGTDRLEGGANGRGECATEHGEDERKRWRAREGVEDELSSVKTRDLGRSRDRPRER